MINIDDKTRRLSQATIVVAINKKIKLKVLSLKSLNI